MRFFSTPARRAVTIAVAALSGVLVAAWLTGSDPVLTAGRPAVSALPSDITDPASARPEADRPSAGQTPDRPTPAPRTLVIPRLGLTMPVRPQGVDPDGAMALPASAFAVGWYRYGSHPLDRAGATVLAGHVDTVAEGTGPLAALGQLASGDKLVVRAGTRTVTYAVTSVSRIGKPVLDLPAIFSRSGAPRLHLVTCGGAYLPEQGGYQDNVVVAARRVATTR